ncbi:hypothetical protein [Parafilimonas sp.]|uniref:hypothetical protein n=1 Tax=Parafilimonas sp. TaxID=1969739 RepID=UPI0039E2EEBD
MLFVTISPKEAKQYAYICTRLKSTVNKMSEARKTLEAVANTSFDKPFAKCMYMLTSESLQCENEMRAQIDSMICNDNEKQQDAGKEKRMPVTKFSSIEGVCRYFEDAYLKSYRKLLKDKKFNTSLRNLMQNHLRQFNASLMQMRLFNDVKTMAN